MLPFQPWLAAYVSSLLEEAEDKRALGDALLNIMVLVAMGDISGEVPSWNMPGLSDCCTHHVSPTHKTRHCAHYLPLETAGTASPPSTSATVRAS